MQGSPVRFEFEDVSPVEKRLKVEIDKTLVNKKLDDSYRQLGRQANLKGFRPGKAPRPLLESMFGKKVASDAARELVNETLGDIIGKQTLRIISEPMLEELADAHKDVHLRYSARIELMPEIDIKDYEGIAVSKREGKVSDEQVNTELERRRQSHQELKPIEGRDKAEAGDVLTVLLTGTLSHLTYKDKEMQVDLGKPDQSPIPGLAAALVGVSLSATAHPVELTMPTEGLPKELGGKTGHFKVVVKAAQVKHVPALDDDFAKDTGEADSLDALKEKIRANILEEDTEEARHEMRLSLVDELLKRNPVPLPQGLIARLARNFLENERGRMQLQMKLLQDQRKENPDAKFTMPTPDQLVQAAQAEAVRNLSIEFVMMALADKEKVEITDADVDTHLADLAKERDKNVARVKAEIQREDPGLQQLRAQLRLEKALDVLESKATITAKA